MDTVLSRDETEAIFFLKRPRMTARRQAGSPWERGWDSKDNETIEHTCYCLKMIVWSWVNAVGGGDQEKKRERESRGHGAQDPLHCSMSLYCSSSFQGVDCFGVLRRPLMNLDIYIIPPATHGCQLFWWTLPQSHLLPPVMMYVWKASIELGIGHCSSKVVLSIRRNASAIDLVTRPALTWQVSINNGSWRDQ